MHSSRYLTDWSAIPSLLPGTAETDCGTGHVWRHDYRFQRRAPLVTLTEFAAQCRYEEGYANLRRLLKNQPKRYLLDATIY